MGRIKRTDSDEGWINRKFAELDRQIRELRSAKSLAASTVGESGGLTIRGILSVVGQAIISGSLELTGRLSMRNEEGVEIVRMGDMTYGRGLAFVRDDGSEAYVLARAFSNSTVQSWGLFDSNGVSIVSEEPLGAGTVALAGLARPQLEHPMQPVAAAPGTPVTCGPYGWERVTSSDTWETLFAYDGRRQNVFLDLKFAAMCSDGVTAGEVRAVNLDTGVQLVSFVGVPWEGIIPAGTTSMTIVDPQPQAAVMPGTTGARARVGIQVRRTAGTGSVTVAVVSSIGG